MSDAVQLKLVENLPAILTAVGIMLTALFTYLNGRKTEKVAAKLDTNTQATEAIKQSVDGAASASVERIKSLEEQIKMLRDHGKDKDKDAALLAQAAATASGAIPTPPRAIRSTDKGPIAVEVVNQPLLVTDKPKPPDDSR